MSPCAPHRLVEVIVRSRTTTGQARKASTIVSGEGLKCQDSEKVRLLPYQAYKVA